MHTPLLVITGPTASGKTTVAVEIARRIRGEIISADSMQVYRHLSIGTAKPTVDETRDVPYHLIDHVDPDDQYNLGRFVKEADNMLAEIQKRGNTPVLCGGTGMYIRGLLYGVFEGGEPDPVVRAELEAEYKLYGLPPLFAELLARDPLSAERYGPNDRQRIIRALEVIRSSGKPFSEFHQQDISRPRFAASTYILSWPRDELYDRINHRAQVMLEAGLLDEVRNYMDNGYSRDNPAVKALGYREIIDHLEGRLPFEDALEAMRRKSRNYAKRQETWFRSVPDAIRISARGRGAEEIAGEIISNIKTSAN